LRLSGLAVALAAQLMLVVFLSATALDAWAEGRGITVLSYNISDGCGGLPQIGEDVEIVLRLLYMPGQQPAEYVVLNVSLVSPEGSVLHVSSSTWGPVVLPGETTRVAMDFAVPRDCGPGDYRLLLAYRVIYIDGSLYESTIVINFNVSGCPRRGLIVTGRLEPVNYPGTAGATLAVKLANLGEERVENVTLRLRLPEGWRPATAYTHADALEAGGSIELRVDDVYVPAWLQPGNYTLLAEVNYTCRICGRNLTATELLYYNITVDDAPPLRMALLRAGWLDGYAYAGERGAAIHYAFQLLEPLRVTGINYSLELPPGFSPTPGTWMQGFTQTAIGYGDALRLEFRVDVPNAAGCYQAWLRILARVEDNSTTTWRPFTAPTELCIDEPRLGLHTLQAYWASWIAGPDGYDLTARIRLLYRGSDTLERLIVNATTAPPAYIRGNTSAQIAATTPATDGAIVELAVPGIVVPPNVTVVEVRLAGRAVLRTSTGGVYEAPFEAVVALDVPREEVLQLAWFNYTPPRIVRGAGIVELHVRLVNRGSEAVQLLWLEPMGLPAGVEFLGADGACLAGPLAGGSACTTTLYLNVSEHTPLGNHSFTLTASYSYRLPGSVVSATTAMNLSMKVEDPARFVPPVSVVSAYWANAAGEPVPVLPGDRDARLQLVLLNNGSTAVTALEAWLEGWESTRDTCSTLPPGASCTLILYVTPDAGSEPVLVLRYSADIYGAKVGTVARTALDLPLSSPDDAVTVVGVEWLTPPEQGSRTARLGVRIARDSRLVTSIVSAKLILPRGLTSPQTGKVAFLSKSGEAIAAADIIAGGLVGDREADRLIAPLLRAGMGPGELYVAELAVDEPLVEPLDAVLVVLWRSATGTLHETRHRVVLPPPISASTLLVWSSPRSPMRGGVANITVYVANRGNAAAYNVYLVLAPLSQTGFPAKPLISLGTLLPGDTVNVTLPVVFNPSTFTGSKSYTFAGIVVVIYDDALGFKRFVNATVATILEPPVRLVLRSVEPRIGEDGLYVAGVVANTGVDVASSVSVTARCGGHAATVFLGNLEPGTEAPFRLQLGRGASCDSIEVTVNYADEYGYIYSASTITPADSIRAAPEATMKPADAAQRQVEDDSGETAVVAAAAIGGVVVGFLAASRRGKRVEKELEELEEGTGP